MRRRVRSQRTAACVIVEHAHPCGVAEGADLVAPIARRSPAIRHRPTAASSPSTARWMRSRERHHRNLHEVIIAPDATEEAIAIIAPQEESAAVCWRAALPIRAAGLTARRSPAVSGAEPRRCRGRRHGAEGRRPRRADRRRARDLKFASGRQARQVQHHHLCQGSRHRRHRCRADEPGRFRAHRRAQGADAAGS